MALAQESQNFLEQLKAAGVKPETIAAFVTDLEGNEKAANVMKSGVFATADYKKKSDELAAQRADVDKLQKANATLAQQLADWETKEVRPQLDKANKLLEKQAALKAQISERARHLKEKYYVEDQDINDLIASTEEIRAAAANATQAPATQRSEEPKGDWVSKEDFNRVSMSLPRVQARMMKLELAHNKLYQGTDKEFDPEAVLDLAEKESMKLDEAAAKLYGYEERKQVIANESKEREFQDRLKKERAAWEANNQANPLSPRLAEDNRRSPLNDVIKRQREAEGKASADKVTPEAQESIRVAREASSRGPTDDAVSRYAAAFRSRKYEGGLAVTPEGVSGAS